MSPRHDSKFLRPLNAHKRHEVLEVDLVGAPGPRIGDVGKPLDLGQFTGPDTETSTGSGPHQATNRSFDFPVNYDLHALGKKQVFVSSGAGIFMVPLRVGRSYEVNFIHLLLNPAHTALDNPR